jgi:PIN domain nuclease of toxin-antitoxin system
VNILLDTHILIWWATNDRQLTTQAREFISNPENNVFISSINIWEVAIKHSKGNLLLPPALLRNSALESGFEILSFRDTHAIQVSMLPPIHQDPFDRALIAQAFAEPMHLLTHDKLVAEYGNTIKLV